jgi:hypothetical protein
MPPTLSELRATSLQHMDRRELSDDQARAMAQRLLISYHCCPVCSQHPCACQPKLEDPLRQG